MSTAADRMKLAATNPYGVAVGQIWRNCDPRSSTSTAKVVSVEGAYAVIDYGHRIEDRMERRVRLDRFRKRANGFERIN